MLKLSESELDNAKGAIQQQGYGTFFPHPPEWDVLVSHWPEVRAELAQVDLDLYSGYDVIFAFAPKSRVNVRRVALLHPHDLIFYTALALALKNGITAARQQLQKERVFSYRTDGAAADRLYNEQPDHRDFTDYVASRIAANAESFVGITDIADFYARIYQHRLVNALQAACGNTLQDQIRVLEKMLKRFSENVSYGIPIGPAASRLFGEAVLIDVDSSLLSFNVDFVRFTDDYVIFAKTPEEVSPRIRKRGFLNGRRYDREHS